MYRQTTLLNAIDYIEDDHQQIEVMFDEFDEAGDEEAARMLDRLLTRLDLHGQLEHALLYPALRRFGAAMGNSIDAAERDHAVLDECIAQLIDENDRRRPCRARVAVLKQYVLDHVRREEADLLPMARLCGIDLDALGRALAAHHQRLLSFVAPQAPQAPHPPATVPPTIAAH